MSTLLIEHLPFLEFFASEHASQQQKKYILEHLTKKQLAALTEVTYNLLLGNIPISAQDHKRLKKLKTVIRVLGNKKRTQKARKSVLSLSLVKILLNTTLDLIKQRVKTTKKKVTK